MYECQLFDKLFGRGRINECMELVSKNGVATGVFVSFNLIHFVL